MADFYGCLESSSFRVKDRDAFLADPDVIQIKHRMPGGFFDEDGEYFAFGWYDQYPSWVLNYMSDNDNDACMDEVNLDITDVIERHILPGDVCRIQVSGNEKLRYIGGGICWVTSKGTAYFDGTTEWDAKITVDQLRQQAAEFSTMVATVV